jgi:spermidine/putrescine transport system permease protein
VRVNRRLAGFLISPLGALLTVAMIVPAILLLLYSFYGFSVYQIQPGFHLEWYNQVFSQSIYRTVAGNTLAIAGPVTAISVVGGYAIAYYVVFEAGRRGQKLLFALVVVSMLASYLARVYAWRTLMGEQGIINSVLESIGIIHRPLGWLLFSRLPVIAAEVNLYMPIATLIMFASLSGLPRDVREASRDLGAGPLQTFRRITLPLSGRGVYGAAALAFFLSCGDYITPVLLGGTTSTQTFGTTIATQLLTNGNYPLGAAISFVMMAAFVVYAIVLGGGMKTLRLLPRGV